MEVRSVGSRSTLCTGWDHHWCTAVWREYAAVQVCSSRVVVGVEVVWLYVPHIVHGVNEAVRQVCGDGHGTPIVADKEAKDTPLAGVTPSLKRIACCLEVNLYVLNEVYNLVWSIQVDSTLRAMSST